MKWVAEVGSISFELGLLIVAGGAWLDRVSGRQKVGEGWCSSGSEGGGF